MVKISSLQAEKVEFDVRPHGVYLKFPCGQRWKITPDELVSLCNRGMRAAQEAGATMLPVSRDWSSEPAK